MKKSSVAVLASGGIDSNLLIAHFLRKGDRVVPVYVRCGFRWEKAEIFWLRKYLRALRGKNLRPLAVIDLPVRDLIPESWAFTGRQVPGIRSRDGAVRLPGRNLLLLSKTAAFCAIRKIPEIAIGSLAGNPFSDATHRFFSLMSQAASRALGFRIRIVAPFRRLKKREILRKGRGLPLHLSFSCLRPHGLRPCRRCNKCAESDGVFR